MAVVSISRIQVRRGKKFSDSGIPQLASGEFGWALDAQELYIGNGSVAEGAPYVGNTRILTDKTNIFDLAGSYSYRSDDSFIQTGATANSPIERSLQDRLDDIVSVRSFGAFGDNTMQTSALQRAIDQLFLNSANKTNPASRVVLHLPPGTYLVNETIYLPPYVTLRGAGSDKTVITSTATGPVFRTVNSASTPGNPASDSITATDNQATRLDISGFTINVPDQYGAMYLVNCKNSIFRDIKVRGNWQSGSGTWADSYAFRLDSLSSIVTCENNMFIDCEISGVYNAVISDYDIKNNTWHNCIFDQSYRGIVFGENTTIGNVGQATGPYNNTIQCSVFDNIDQQAIWVKNGTNNTSKNNQYYSVGYDGGSSTNVGNLTSVLEFDTATNRSEDDWFERSGLYGTNTSYFQTVPYVSEITGPVNFAITAQKQLDIIGTTSAVRLLRLPVSGDRHFIVDYIYSSNVVGAVRSGTLNIVVGESQSSATISDEYNYTGDTAYQSSLKFDTELADFDTDSTVETLTVLYTNDVLSDTGTFKYTLRYSG